MEQPKVILANIEAQIAAWLREQSGSGNEASDRRNDSDNCQIGGGWN